MVCDAQNGRPRILSHGGAMGIRFLCPNGHKLNVKADLAGKRASCPECGAKLVIPSASTDRAADSVSGTIADVAAAHSPVTIGVGQVAPLASVAAPAAPPQAANWYVRPVGGGQFGPADDDVFCAWIAEGRVTADAQIWRDGWAEWRLARDAADVLPIPLAATPIVAAPQPAVPTVDDSPPQLDAVVAEPVISAAIRSAPNVLTASQYAFQRRQTRKTQVALAVVMLVAVIILAGVLAWVLRRNVGATSQAAPQYSVNTPAFR